MHWGEHALLCGGNLPVRDPGEFLTRLRAVVEVSEMVVLGGRRDLGVLRQSSSRAIQAPFEGTWLSPSRRRPMPTHGGAHLRTCVPISKRRPERRRGLP